MKTHPLFILLCAAGLVFNASCKKEEVPCQGRNLCFTVGGNNVSVDVVRQPLPNQRFRLFCENVSGSATERVTIDVFGNTVSEYSITENAGTAGDINFLYQKSDSVNAVTYQGIAGKLDLTSVSDEKWSGTFSGTVSSGGVSYTLADGRFISVPLE